VPSYRDALIRLLAERIEQGVAGMAVAMNPAAPHHLPVFITAPGESDVFLNGAAIFLVVAVITLGSVYFRLHALPEHMAHKNASKVQFEVVALLLALVPIPDFHEPLSRMADSLAKMAGLRPQSAAEEPPAVASPTEKPLELVPRDSADEPSRPQVVSAASEQPDRTIQAAG
jgi:hypothetical protein